MFRKNVAGQFVYFQGVDSTTGAVKSGVTWTVRRGIDGTFAAATGTVTEDGTTGWYKFAMSQADTNGNNIGFSFTGSGAVPQTINIVTTAADPTDAVRLGLTALPNVVSGSAGALPTTGTGANQLSVTTGAVVVGTNNDKTGYGLASTAVQAIWDALISNLTTAGSVGKRIADFLTGDAFARLGAPAGASVSADIAANKTVVDAIKVRTDLTPEGIKKNTARANFTFVMTDSTTHQAKTGLTNASFTKKYRLDAGSVNTLSGTITEVDATNFPGMYSIDLTAGELNGDMVILRFAASNADDLEIAFKTSP